MDSRGLRAALAFATFVWLCIAGAGLFMLWRFDNAPGDGAAAPAQWPVHSRLARATERPTLILLAHPQCSCTTASLGELAEVLARSRSRPKTFVVFLKPEGVSDKWVESGLWETASKLPGVTLLRDASGFEARQFGASTSGQTLLYDARGALAFSGGITAARAHAGDNAGRQSLVALLGGDASARPTTNVFGCPLFNTTPGAPASRASVN